MARKSLRFIAAALIIAYLALIPTYLSGRLERNYYNEWMQGEQEPFTGVITCWHIVGFKTYAGSLSSWLEKRAARVEKKHFGVFVTIEAMSVEDCMERLSKGERADIYSFPSGWCGEDMLLELTEQPEAVFLDGIERSGKSEDKQYAIPYVLSGYALLVNSQIAQARSVDSIPDDPTKDGWLLDAAQKMTFTQGKKKEQVYGICGDPVILASLGVKAQSAEFDAFKDKLAGSAVVDARAAGDLLRKLELGQGFVFQLSTITNYTDLVQYMGLDRQIEEGKIPYAMELMRQVVDEGPQENLAGLGGIPAIVLNEDPSFTSELPQKLYQALKKPRVPNTFSLYRMKESLRQAAVAAVSGDESGVSEFNRIFKELVNMP